MPSSDDIIYYFSFGSNLLQERIRLRNPSAEYRGIGVLNDYALRFFEMPPGFFEEGMATWHGCTATVVEMKGGEVYGTIWCLDRSDIPSLDKQESVSGGLYHPLDPVRVVATNGGVFNCRTYQGMKDAPLGSPSPYYLDVILRGAVQSGLPSHYISQLRQVSHNGYLGPCLLYQNVLNTMEEAARGRFEVDEVKEVLAEKQSE